MGGRRSDRKIRAEILVEATLEEQAHVLAQVLCSSTVLEYRTGTAESRIIHFLRQTHNLRTWG